MNFIKDSETLRERCTEYLNANKLFNFVTEEEREVEDFDIREVACASIETTDRHCIYYIQTVPIRIDADGVIHCEDVGECYGDKYTFTMDSIGLDALVYMCEYIENKNYYE